MKAMKKAPCAALALGLSACAFAQEIEPAPLKVLMIGNSFSQSVLVHAPKIAADLGKKLDLAQMSIGGCTLDLHAENLATTNTPYGISWNYCGKRSITNLPFGAMLTEKYDKTAKVRRYSSNIIPMLKADKWNIVTIQQGSHQSWDEKSFQPHADKLIAAIRKYAPQAEIRVHQTWSYNNFDTRICDPQTKGPGTWGFDQTGMYERLTANYKKLAADNGFKIIPVGRAVQNYRKTTDVLADFTKDAVGALETKNGEMSGDSIHLSRIGQYLQGLVWVGSLFDVDVTRCAYQPDDKHGALYAQLRQCAAKAVKTGL